MCGQPPRPLSSFQVMQVIQRNQAIGLNPQLQFQRSHRIVLDSPVRYFVPKQEPIEPPPFWDSRFKPLRTAEPSVKPFWMIGE